MNLNIGKNNGEDIDEGEYIDAEDTIFSVVNMASNYRGTHIKEEACEKMPNADLIVNLDDSGHMPIKKKKTATKEEVTQESQSKASKRAIISSMIVRKKAFFFMHNLFIYFKFTR